MVRDGPSENMKVDIEQSSDSFSFRNFDSSRKPFADLRDEEPRFVFIRIKITDKIAWSFLGDFRWFSKS